MLDWVRFIISSMLMVSGLMILMTAVIGVFRFDYVLNRMQAAAMGDTLGLLFCMLALMVGAPDLSMVLKLLLIVLFLWLSSPVSSHLIARLEVTVNPLWQQLPPKETPQSEDER